MSLVSSLTEVQEQIVLKMYRFNPEQYRGRWLEDISKADTFKRLDEFHVKLTQDQKAYREMSFNMPAKHTIGQFGANTSWDPSGSTIPHVGVLVLKKSGEIRFLVVEGNPLDALRSTTHVLECLLEIIPHLLESIEQRKNEQQFSLSAATPDREIGLLREKLSLAQMQTLSSVLHNLVGTIDLRQFRKSDAAMILNTLRERMGFTVDKYLRIRYVHVDGESDWYGTGEGNATSSRDQVRHISSSRTYKPINFIADWLNAVKNLNN